MTRKLCVVCYRRVENETTKPLTWKDAAKEREILQRMHPKNFYTLEEVRE